MTKKTNWFCLIDGKEVGPVGSGQIKKLIVAGTLKLTDKIRKEDGGWRELSKISKLMKMVEAAEVGSKADGGEKIEHAADDEVESEYPEWVPKSLVSYTNFTIWTMYVLFTASTIYYFWTIHKKVAFYQQMYLLGGWFLFMGIAKWNFSKQRNALLNGDRAIFWGMNIIMGMGVLLFGIAGLGLLVGEGTLLFGLMALLVGAVLCGPWFYFALNYGKHFEYKEWK